MYSTSFFLKVYTQDNYFLFFIEPVRKAHFRNSAIIQIFSYIHSHKPDLSISIATVFLIGCIKYPIKVK